jgi:hypothetical protein
LEEFLEGDHLSEEEKARRGALQGFESGAFLLATPYGDCQFVNSHFQTACILRLGLDQPFLEDNKTMCVCGKPITTEHLLRCKKGGEVIDRHDAITRTLRQLVARAGIKVTYNPTGCFCSPSQDDEGNVVHYGNLRPDLKLFYGGSAIGKSIDSRHVVVDVRVTDSTCPSQLGCGITKSEQSKISKYQSACDANQLIFKPIVMETLGKWSDTTTDFVKDLVKRAFEKDPGGPPECVLLTYWRKRLSSVLQRYNAVVLLGRYARANSLSNGRDCLFDESTDPMVVGAVNV